MVAPIGAPSMAEAVRAGADVYAALRRELAERKLSTGLGDEGGFAPEITEPEEVLRLLVQAIDGAGYRAGRDGVSIALDLAASEFRQPDGRYLVAGVLLSSGDLIERLARITAEFPVHLIEDGLGEYQPGHHQRRDRARHRERVTDQAESDRHGHRDPGGDGGVPPGWLPADGVAPVRGNRGLVHRGPGRRHRVRAAEIRRPGPRRACL
jgi:hypothetical protein